MPSGPETTFTKYLMRKLPDDIYSMKVLMPFLGGVPDCYFSGKGGDLWAEMKWIARIPKRDTTEIDVGLSDLQKRWLAGRYHEGRNVCVIVASDIGCCILRDINIFNPILKSKLTMKNQDVVRWLTNQTQE